jgi:hypothetical protein
MHGRLGYLHLVHLAEANAQRRRLADGTGSAVAKGAALNGPKNSASTLDISVIMRLAIVLALAFAADAVLGMAIG